MAEQVVIRGPFVNNPRRNAHIVRTAKNARNPWMKTRLLQILYGNPFTGLDHEDQYTHLTKFYEIAGTLGMNMKLVICKNNLSYILLHYLFMIESL